MASELGPPQQPATGRGLSNGLALPVWRYLASWRRSCARTAPLRLECPYQRRAPARSCALRGRAAQRLRRRLKPRPQPGRPTGRSPRQRSFLPCIERKRMRAVQPSTQTSTASHERLSTGRRSGRRQLGVSRQGHRQPDVRLLAVSVLEGSREEPVGAVSPRCVPTEDQPQRAGRQGRSPAQPAQPRRTPRAASEHKRPGWTRRSPVGWRAP